MPDDYKITEAMIVFGGGFVHKLGWLYRAADPVNQAKLKAAFPELWTQYTELAELHAQREAKP